MGFFSSKANKLHDKKDKLLSKSERLEYKFNKGDISREEYLEKSYNLFDGRFKEDAIRDMDEEIKQERTKRKAMASIATLAVIAIFIFSISNYIGITGFLTAGGQEGATLAVGENYTQNATENLTFIEATRLSASGNVYGHGETWIYLVSDGQRRLVYYADTRQDGGSPAITGMVTAGSVNVTNSTNTTNSGSSSTNNSSTNQTNNSPINDTNSSDNETANVTVNQTINQTGNSTGNATIDDTNQTVNATVGGNQTNSTINQTAGGNTTAVNETSAGGNATETNSTSNQTQDTSDGTTEVPFAPEIITDKDTYSVGENVSVSVEPENSTYTLYLHSPSDTYIVIGSEFAVVETGEHTLSALVSKGNQTERVTKDFYVTTESPTHSFAGQCVETCTLANSTEVELEIVVDGTRLELNNVTYDPANDTSGGNNDSSEQGSRDSQQTTEETQTESSQSNQGRIQAASQRKCLVRNPNVKPKECFTDEEWSERFPSRNYTIVNSLGDKMATVGSEGNLYLKGQLVEGATGEPLQYDYVVEGGGQSQAWIDAVTGDLYLRGQVSENMETLSWDTKQDDIIANSEGMYLAVFSAKNGNLYLRGEVKEGGST